MSRAVRVALAVAVAGLAALALFTGRRDRGKESRVELTLRPPTAAAFRPDASLRNVTRAPVEYTNRPGPGARGPRRRTLAVGAVDRLVIDQPVEVSFDNGRRATTYLVHPEKPYVFRYDENDIIRVYPGSHGRADAADLAPFVPTPPEVVDRMLELAAVGPGDVVYDLGCGDGRMIIAAAKRGARGVGVELDAALLAECRAGAKREGVEHLVRFVEEDALTARLTGATVLALYLLPESLEALAPRFARELPPGARVVSHDYAVPGWEGRLVSKEVLDAADGGREHRILLYRMSGGR